MTLTYAMLNPEAVEVYAVVAGYGYVTGYAARKVIVEENKCSKCKELSVSNSAFERMEDENNYLKKLSRVGLIVPATDFRHQIAKCFTILDFCQHLTRDSTLPERTAAEIALERNNFPVTFLCSQHNGLIKYLKRTVVNVFFNNARKQIQDMKRKDDVKEFKRRQTKRKKTE